MREEKKNSKEKRKEEAKNEDEVAEKWKANKKELSKDLERAIISEEASNELLESVIEEEKHVLNVLENANSELIESKFHDYLPERTEGNYVPESDIRNSQDDKKYEKGTLEPLEIKDDTEKEKEKEKRRFDFINKNVEERKFVSFKPSY